MDWWEFFIVMVVVLPIMTLWLGCIIDAVMRPDISGWGKALWVLFILFIPLIGSIVYIVTRPPVIVQTGLADSTWRQSPMDMTVTATEYRNEQIRS
jgi:hypothetical protein